MPLHVFLLGPAPEGMIWDHKNRDKMDNRKENLRLVTPTVSKRNQNVYSNNTSGVKGVFFDNRKRIKIGVGGRQIDLGHFDTLSEATTARLAAEKKYWGNDR